MVKKEEYERLVKIGLYYKYCFILLAKEVMGKTEVETRLFRCALDVDTITENEVKELRKRQGDLR